MGSYEHAVDVERPVRAVYDQWTQFESYPSFMQDVEQVRQTADDMTRWRVSIAGITREYDARILEQVPDEVISWMSTEGPEQGGTVRFSRLTPERTRVTLRMDFDPHGVTEKAGDALGFVESSVRRSAEEFKRFIEEQGQATGAWRGEIHEGRTVGGVGGAMGAMGTDDMGGIPATGSDDIGREHASTEVGTGAGDWPLVDGTETGQEDVDLRGAEVRARETGRGE